MMFLDVIATPFYLLLGGAAFFILLGIGCLMVLTMVIMAIFHRSSKKEDPSSKENESTDQ